MFCTLEKCDGLLYILCTNLTALKMSPRGCVYMLFWCDSHPTCNLSYNISKTIYVMQYIKMQILENNEVHLLLL